MNILTFISGIDGCGYYRAVVPSLAINKYPGHQARIRTYFSKEVIDWADIVIFQKQYKEEVFPWLEYAKNQKKITLYEADDDYFNIPDWNPTAKWFGENIHLWQKFMEATDGIIVSTEHLKQQLLKYNPNIYVFENGIDFDLIEKLQKSNPLQYIYRVDRQFQKTILTAKEIQQSKEQGYIHIGWGGSPTHQKDLVIIQDVLLQILAENPKIRFFAIGYTLDWLTKKAPLNQFYMIEGVDVQSYLPLLDFCKLDIGLAPLEDNLFNRSKSNLKLIEYLALKIAPIASKVENYQKTLENQKDCGILVENNTKNWQKSVNHLIKSKESRELVIKNGYELIKKNFNSYPQSNQRLKLFESLLLGKLNARNHSLTLSPLS